VDRNPVTLQVFKIQRVYGIEGSPMHTTDPAICAFKPSLKILLKSLEFSANIIAYDVGRKQLFENGCLSSSEQGGSVQPDGAGAV
jgi:hypothetical protein